MGQAIAGSRVRSRLRPVQLLLLVVVAKPVDAQLVPIGPEFQVNTYTTGEQSRAVVAGDGAGNFVVVWYSRYGDGDSNGSVQAQRYDATGTAVGPQFQVNSYTTGYQRFPEVASDALGNFVVVWHSDGSAGSDSDASSIQAQRFDANGTPLGGEFQVNSYTTQFQTYPRVAAAPTGEFVVVWRNVDQYLVPTVWARRFDASGVPAGPEFEVNSYTTTSGDIGIPAVAMGSTGEFVVTWYSQGSPQPNQPTRSIQARRFDAGGVPLGPQFQVNSYTSVTQERPFVALDSAGRFVVTWHSFGSLGTDNDIFNSTSIQARRFDAAGAPAAPQFQVNTYTTNNQFGTRIGMDPGGTFVVSWHSYGSAGSDSQGSSIQSRVYAAGGGSLGGEFQVNSYTTAYQFTRALASIALGTMAIAWTGGGSSGSDQDNASVHARVFALPPTTTSSTSTTVTSATSSSSTSSSSSSSSTTSTSSTTTTTLPTTDLLLGRVAIVRGGSLAKFVAKPPAGDAFILPASSPTSVGGALRVFDVASAAGDDTYGLPAAGWKGLGSPAGSKGWKYRGAGSVPDPCKVALVKPTVIKAVCVHAGVMLAPPFQGDIGIWLTVGTTDRYCARFGGDETKNDAGGTKRKDAPAPGACP